MTSATPPSNGIAPAGTVTFSTNPQQVVTLTPGFDPNGNAIATASITVGQNNIPSGGTITASYTPTTPSNYTASTSSPVAFTTTTAKTNYTSTTTFTITDNYGTFPGGTGTYPTTPNPSFPVLDSLTLNMHVKTTTAQDAVFLVYANGVLLTPASWTGGFLNNPCSTSPPPCSGLKIDTNGNATFTIPQLNGYLALPSGQVQFTVLYDGWYSAGGGFFGVFLALGQPSLSQHLLDIGQVGDDLVLNRQCRRARILGKIVGRDEHMAADGSLLEGLCHLAVNVGQLVVAARPAGRLVT